MVDGALAGAVTGALIGTMVAPPPDDMDHADRDPRMGAGDAGAAMDDAADRWSANQARMDLARLEEWGWRAGVPSREWRSRKALSPLLSPEPDRVSEARVLCLDPPRRSSAQRI